MNFFFVTIATLLSIYVILKWFVSSSSKKISIYVRKIIIFSSVLLAILALVAGRYIFSLPFLLAILPLIKTKAGITLFQILRLWTLFRTLKNNGRFDYSSRNNIHNTQTMSKDEACKILNLDPKKKNSKEEILKAYKKIMKKIHPDVSPELGSLACIVNQAKEVLMK